MPRSYPHADKYFTIVSVPRFMGFLKGKSTLMIFDRHVNLKYKDRSGHFWSRGELVDIVGRNGSEMKEYIKNQLGEFYMNNQYIDPFMGSKNK